MSDETWLETQGPGLWVLPQPLPPRLSLTACSLPCLHAVGLSCCSESSLPEELTQPPFQIVFIPCDDFNGDLKRWEIILVLEVNCKAIPNASFHRITVVFLLFSLS